MKYLYLTIVTAFVALAVITLNPQPAFTNNTGAPASNSGSPLDGGFTCAQAGCHGGSAVARASMITSNIPASGYVPGTDYTITATLNEAGIVRFGFQLSPQFQNGTTAGTLTPVDGNTQLIGTRYITHTFAGTGGNTNKAWSFKWTAPSAGRGPVTFYSAFVAGNNNGAADAADKIFTSTTTTSENGHLGVSTAAAAGMCVYPTPFTNTLTIEKGVQQFETAVVKLFSLDGKLVIETGMNSTTTLNTESLPTGIYILHITAPGVNVVQKVAK